MRWFEQATRANIRASVDHLRHGSALLERRIERDGLLIVGAEYCVEQGEGGVSRWVTPQQGKKR